MSHQGKHRRSGDNYDAGPKVKKVAAFAGMAATAAAVAAVGVGAGTANADGGGILHNLFSPNKPSQNSSKSVTGPSLITQKPNPSPQTSIFQYVTPGQNGTGIKGICFFNC